MNKEFTVQLLKDPKIFPSVEVIAKALGPVNEAFLDLLKNMAALNVVYEWRYYQDGKAWLMKASHKNKTVFWLSLWDKGFKVSFFFTEKTKAGIKDLKLDETRKARFLLVTPVGKLIPFIIDVTSVSALPELELLIKYKIAT
ncbi:MAG: DUF3788 domain-containing protein [Erysipelotrichaceae bacterium]|jgi:hypothetical protein|nr:DUF3788 domain-containing protein [Erysipelotrichaceae bacterium]